MSGRTSDPPAGRSDVPHPQEKSVAPEGGGNPAELNHAQHSCLLEPEWVEERRGAERSGEELESSSKQQSRGLALEWPPPPRSGFPLSVLEWSAPSPQWLPPLCGLSLRESPRVACLPARVLEWPAPSLQSLFLWPPPVPQRSPPLGAPSVPSRAPARGCKPPPLPSAQPFPRRKRGWQHCSAVRLRQAAPSPCSPSGVPGPSKGGGAQAKVPCVRCVGVRVASCGFAGSVAAGAAPVHGALAASRVALPPPPASLPGAPAKPRKLGRSRPGRGAQKAAGPL